jgi:N-acetylglucosamine-6-phosphate deacetylase
MNPARVLQLEGRGSIEPGAQADLTMIDENFHVMRTLVEGKVVFERHS